MSDGLHRNPLSTALLVVGLAAGGWFFFQHFEVHGLDKVRVKSKSTQDDVDFVSLQSDSASRWSSSSTSLIATPVSSAREVTSRPPFEPVLPPTPNLRIATWALAGLGPERVTVSNARRIANILRTFDLVAVQQLRSEERDFVPRLLAEASGEGRQYEYLLGPVHASSGEQLAFFYDVNRLVSDRTQLYTVADPDQRMMHDPLVGWFRAAQLDAKDAWTFSLVNVRIELARARQETAELAKILSSVQTDGRGEDDCVVAGLFQADDSYLTSLLRQPSIKLAIRSTPTDIFARHQTSNLMFDAAKTAEYLGRGGVLDFLRRENLSLAEAETISPYLPVYAEFSAREGGVR